MANKVLFDEAITLNLDVNRVASSAQENVIRLIKELERQLIAKISGDELTEFNKARLNQQLREARQIIREYYAEIAEIGISSTDGIAEISAKSTSQALTASLAGQYEAIIPTTTYMETLAGNAIIQGATQKRWWDQQDKVFRWKFENAVRIGLVSSETNSQIIKRVRDVARISMRDAEALVRTSVMTVSNLARQKVFEQNSDIIKYYIWTATLDARICRLCIARSDRKWTVDKKPVGHTIPFSTPPIHFRDRCSLYVETKSFKELGINIEDAPRALRSSAEGVTTDPTFKDYMDRKGKKFMDERLGVGRAELYRDGKIELDQLLDSRGNELTTQQLRELYG